MTYYNVINRIVGVKNEPQQQKKHVDLTFECYVNIEIVQLRIKQVLGFAYSFKATDYG